MSNSDSSQYTLRYNEISTALEFAQGNIWVPISLGAGSPAGSNTQVQFNSTGAFGASSGFTYSNVFGLSLNNDAGSNFNFNASDGSTELAQISSDSLGNLSLGNTSFIFSLNVDGSMTLPPLNAAPSSPVEGDIWYNFATKKLQFYNGTAVQTVTSA